MTKAIKTLKTISAEIGNNAGPGASPMMKRIKLMCDQMIAAIESEPKALSNSQQALQQIQGMTMEASVRAPDAGYYARVLENIQHLAAKTIRESGEQPNHEGEPITPERMSVADIPAPAEQVLSMEIIQAALTKRYPQGWVLAWTEAATKPPINQSDGRSEVARTEWSDSCAAHGSISQRLGLAVFLKGSIKHNIVRRNA